VLDKSRAIACIEILEILRWEIVLVYSATRMRRNGKQTLMQKLHSRH